MCLLVIFRDSIISFCMLPLTNKLSESLIVSNDYQLKIFLAFSILHDSGKMGRIRVNLQIFSSERLSSNFMNFSYLRRAAAKLSAFGPSKFVVGSSSASIPQLRQKVSANANRIISEARTWIKIERCLEKKDKLKSAKTILQGILKYKYNVSK